MALQEEEERQQEMIMQHAWVLRRLLRARTVLLMGTITDQVAKEITTQVLLMQEEDENKPITVFINSRGGEADAGFAIYDILRFVTPPVRTVCTGLCASAAILPFLAAPRERRFSLPHSRFLLHQPVTTVVGVASDIAISANELRRLRERYNSIVASETGKSVEQVTADTDRDFWLTAEEALEYGLVGKIITSLREFES
ncbi:MAG: hypothetical protein HZRFUVUK_001791 [Candidatus Fervidibacterota bacterium]